MYVSLGDFEAARRLAEQWQLESLPDILAAQVRHSTLGQSHLNRPCRITQAGSRRSSTGLPGCPVDAALMESLPAA